MLYDGGNTTVGALTEAGAENTTSYEVGLKSVMWDHRADFRSLAGYSWTTGGIQLTAVGGAANRIVLLNATRAIGAGVETSFEVKPVEALLLTANASYNFTQIQDPGLEVSGCGGGCTMLNARDPVTGNYKINGNPLPNAPRWIYNFTGRYSFPVADDTEIYALTDWSLRGTEDFFLYKAAEFDGQSLLLGGLRVGYIDHAKGWEIAGFVHNILDEVKVTGAVDFDNLTGYLNDPRIVGAEVRVSQVLKRTVVSWITHLPSPRVEKALPLNERRPLRTFPMRQSSPDRSGALVFMRAPGWRCAVERLR